MPDSHNPPPGYEAPIVCDGVIEMRDGKRLTVDIYRPNLPGGLAGAHDVEYAPYHICSSKTVVHRVHHDEQHPSHLVLPIIPLG